MKIEIDLPDPPASFSSDALPFLQKLQEVLAPLTKFKSMDGHPLVSGFLRCSEDQCWSIEKPSYTDGATEDDMERGWWIAQILIGTTEDGMDHVDYLYSGDFMGDGARVMSVIQQVVEHLHKHAMVPRGMPGALMDVMAQIQRALDACKQ